MPRHTEVHLQLQEMFDPFFGNGIPHPRQYEYCMSLAVPVAEVYALYRDAIEGDAEAAVRASLLEEVEASRCRADAQIAAEKAKCLAMCERIAATEALAQKVLVQSLEALRPTSHVATATATLFATRDAVAAEVKCKAAEVADRAAAAAETPERKAGEGPAAERATAEAAEAKRKAVVAAAAEAKRKAAEAAAAEAKRKAAEAAAAEEKRKAAEAAAAEAKRKVTEVLLASVGADHQSSPLAESMTAVPPSPSAADETHASKGKRCAAIGDGSVAKRKK